MTAHEFQKIFEQHTPPAIAWKGDNVGLQIGRGSDTIRNILVSLDATIDVAKEAIKKNANLIVTHHPLLFQPLKNLTPSSRVGELAMFIAENKIKAASCILPLTDNTDLPPQFGLRHRAGIGVSEANDATAIIISEETGELSYAKHGRVKMNIGFAELEKLLNKDF